MHNFLTQLCRNPHFTYYLYSTHATSYLNNPILYHYPPQLIYFRLSLYYSHKPNFTVEFNLQQLLKRINTPNIVRTNLNYEKS